ncbi:hypothetical protein AG1IA_03792 [Rhizoctonia solani AG-1 IA]|uniref:Uncharacterized protein n=1 Tax=Thanatephorus cucumeris (strain AG1-IA) TaxID=983506 RepID=L8WW19_THACA|nr:hypothetical protein AG1IA_03792 [Rhizoctonia solani AG-1 IA]
MVSEVMALTGTTVPGGRTKACVDIEGASRGLCVGMDSNAPASFGRGENTPT